MQLARVIGQVVATVKEPGLDSFKILIVQNIDPALPDGESTGSPYAAVDLVGAGEGEIVTVAQGSAARIPDAAANTATDSAVVAIVDTLSVDGAVTFKK
ncbi:MAG: ethanolamine utilization protein EutN [Acidimicrobiia bacterium]|nr:EutN/CcmL family microcompartment protein [bacterium]MXZ30036.1 ethanolamine utilization protein EutN [Acidimicrobiia bacterium]MYB23516.1 ethanolamine utilization protein EutN [Acidimicrobiia bacterium]MYE67061.1 ethanolamine utilization protein EutN [Acidimicrobiia bacterium]MYJ13232.1 ethanolamine utilization protein EutN [Acidimicrobiia bacterium]